MFSHVARSPHKVAPSEGPATDHRFEGCYLSPSIARHLDATGRRRHAGLNVPFTVSEHHRRVLFWWTLCCVREREEAVTGASVTAFSVAARTRNRAGGITSLHQAATTITARTTSAGNVPLPSSLEQNDEKPPPEK